MAGILCHTGLWAQPAFFATYLRCEYRDNPLGLDLDTGLPRFSWTMSDSRRGAIQTAYQLTVASSAQANEGDVWDSGKVISRQSIHILYQGPALEAGKRYHWRVRLWDAAGKPSAWSEKAFFEMAYLSTATWKASWIGFREPPRVNNTLEGKWIWVAQAAAAQVSVYLRKRFIIPADKPLSRLRLRYAVDDRCEIQLNGEKVTQLLPNYPWRERRFLLTDLTRFARPGDNVLTVAAAQTRPGKPGGFNATLILEFTDGSVQVIYTDESWQASTLGQVGWSPVLPLKGWDKARVVENFGGKTWGDLPSPYQPPRSQWLRREFVVRKKVSQARAYVSGLGGYYLYLNGQVVGKQLLAPGWTAYPKRIHYQVFDVGALLQRGPNAIGALLGNLWWSGEIGYRGLGQYSEGPLRLLLQLDIRYEDGTQESLLSDKNWKAHSSPILTNSLYDGESYDARLENPAWCLPGLADKDWLPVEVLNEKKDILVADPLPPISSVAEIKPLTVTEIAPGRYVFDMGRNLAGWARLRVQGKAGTRITLRFAETLSPSGNLRTEALRTARATDEYILNGKGVEVWEPHFTYHGFRYVEMSGFPGMPTRESLTGLVVHNALPQRGQFSSSNELLNRIQEAVRWTLQNNLYSVITDSPQRDERLAWAGDIQVSASTALYNLDMSLMHTKALRDITDSQREDGELFNVNPNAFGGGAAAPGWADALVLVAWKLYQFSGDKRVLEDNYPAMTRWYRLKEQEVQQGLREKGGFGDWQALAPTSPEYVSAAYYAYTTRLLVDIAGILGKSAEADLYLSAAEKTTQAFNQKYYNKANHSYANNSQTANLLPLAFGLTLPGEAPQVAANIAADVKRRDYHLSTGFLGTQYLLPMLSRYGFQEEAYRLAVQWTYPSWGYMLEKEATTLWETWDSDRQTTELSSRDHIVHTSVGEWFYRFLAGIELDEKAPGFRHFYIAPQVGSNNLQWVVCRLGTPYGYVSVQWEKQEQGLKLKIEIPANTSARVELPASSANQIKEGTLPLSKSEGIRGVKAENGLVSFEAPAGKYEFTISR